MRNDHTIPHSVLYFFIFRNSHFKYQNLENKSSYVLSEQSLFIVSRALWLMRKIYFGGGGASFLSCKKKRNKNLRSVAIIIIVSVVTCSSSSSITASLLSSPRTSYWSRSCCSGGALGRSCFTTSRLMFGASFIRSLLRIWDLIAFNRMVLMCSRTSQVAHWSVSSGLGAESCWCVSWSLKTTGPKAISTLKYNTIWDRCIVCKEWRLIFKKTISCRVLDRMRDSTTFGLMSHTDRHHTLSHTFLYSNFSLFCVVKNYDWLDRQQWFLTDWHENFFSRCEALKGCRLWTCTTCVHRRINTLFLRWLRSEQRSADCMKYWIFRWTSGYFIPVYEIK